MQTPTIDSLVKEGVELDRHYVHMMCTPSRSALQSGRLPVHVITQLANPCDANGAIPRNMTGLAAKLKLGGYATHQVGKWDAGMVTPHHTPQGRGYDSSLNYFGHGNWAWSEAEWGGSQSHRGPLPVPGVVDLWDTDRPAASLNGTGHEELLFRARMLSILAAHDQSTPLFLQYDSKLVHYPLQASPYVALLLIRKVLCRLIRPWRPAERLSTWTRRRSSTSGASRTWTTTTGACTPRWWPSSTRSWPTSPARCARSACGTRR